MYCMTATYRFNVTLHIIVLVSLKGSVVYAAVKSLIKLWFPVYLKNTGTTYETLFFFNASPSRINKHMN